MPKGKILLTGARHGENPTEVSTETDQLGRFELKHLRFRSYWFGPSKEDEAYGDGEAVSARGGVKLKEPTESNSLLSACCSGRGIVSGTVEDLTSHKPVVALLRFAEIIEENPNKKIFVHCRVGVDRTGVAIASYRMAKEGWSPDEAMKDMQFFGFSGFHHVMFPKLVRFEKEFPEHLKTSSAF